MTIRPEEITGATSAFTRVMQALARRTTELTDGKPRYVFLGRAEFEEIKGISKHWGHEWPIPGKRPEIFGTPIYIVDDENFLEVL